MGTLKTCIDWDGVAPSHCLVTPLAEHDFYDVDEYLVETCMDQRCANAYSPQEECSGGTHL